MTNKPHNPSAEEIREIACRTTQIRREVTEDIARTRRLLADCRSEFERNNVLAILRIEKKEQN